MVESNQSPEAEPVDCAPAPVVRIERRATFAPKKVHLYQPKPESGDRALILVAKTGKKR